MIFVASIDTSIYGTVYHQGDEVNTDGWDRKQLLQFLSLGLMSPTSIVTVVPAPTGSYLMHSSSIAPEGYLPCDGASHLKTDEPALDAVLAADGYRYGSDATHFSTPNFTGRVPVDGVPGSTGGHT